MKRAWLFLPCLMCAALLLATGCINNPNEGQLNLTPVTIVIGQPNEQSESAAIGNITAAAFAIPADVTQVILEAKKINPQQEVEVLRQETFTIVDRSGIEVNWSIESGKARYFTAKALNNAGETTHYGVVRTDLIPNRQTDLIIETRRSFNTDNWYANQVGDYAVFSPTDAAQGTDMVCIFTGEGDMVNDYPDYFGGAFEETHRVYDSANNDYAFSWFEDSSWLKLREYDAQGYYYFLDPSNTPSDPTPMILLPGRIKLQEVFTQNLLAQAKHDPGDAFTVNRKLTLVDFEDVELPEVAFVGAAVVVEEEERPDSHEKYTRTKWLVPQLGVVRETVVRENMQQQGLTLQSQVTPQDIQMLYGKANGVQYGAPPPGTVVVVTNLSAAQFNLNYRPNISLSGSGVYHEFTNLPPDIVYTADFIYAPAAGYFPPPGKSAKLGQDAGIVIAGYYRSPLQFISGKEDANPVAAMWWENFLLWQERDETVGAEEADSLYVMKDSGQDPLYIDTTARDYIFALDIFANRVTWLDGFTESFNRFLWSFWIPGGTPAQEAVSFAPYLDMVNAFGPVASVFGDCVFWDNSSGYGGVEYSPLDQDPYANTKEIVDALGTQWKGGLVDTWGEWAVFLDLETYNIQATNYLTMPGPDNVLLSTVPGATSPPRIYRDRVVWAANRDGDWDVFTNTVSDPVGNETQLSDSDADESMPDIYGDIVVWEYNNGTDLDIYFIDLASDVAQPMPMVSGPADQFSPRIFGNKVVWLDNRYHTDDLGIFDIFYLDLGISYNAPLIFNFSAIGSIDLLPPVFGSVTQPQLDDGAMVYSGKAVINQDGLVAYETNNFMVSEFGGEGGWAEDFFDEETRYLIATFDLQTGVERIVTSITGGLSARDPAIFDSLIAYVEYDPVATTIDCDVRAYDYVLDDVVDVGGAVSGSDQLHPAVGDGLVVWEDERDGNAEIYLYDVTHGIGPINISNDSGVDRNPRLSGSRVVWDNTANGETHIWGYDVRTGLKQQLTDAAGDQKRPDISGDLMVYEAYPLPPAVQNADIHLLDLTTGEVTVVCDDAGNKSQVRIDSGLIVWHDDTSQHIRAYDLDTDVAFQVTDGPEDERFPDVAGDYIIYSDANYPNAGFYQVSYFHYLR